MAIWQPNTLLFHLLQNYTLHGQICQNGFYFTNRGDVDDSGSTLAQYANALISSWGTRLYDDWKAILNTEVHFTAWHCSVVIPHNGPIVEQIIVSGSGNQPDESLPSYCAAVLSLRSGFGGKSNRGRLYLSGISEGNHSAGELDNDTFAGLQIIGDKLINNYGPVGSDGLFRYVIYSRKTGDNEQGRPTSFGIVPVNQCIARRVLGTQRHRLKGVGT